MPRNAYSNSQYERARQRDKKNRMNSEAAMRTVKYSENRKALTSLLQSASTAKLIVEPELILKKAEFHSPNYSLPRPEEPEPEKLPLAPKVSFFAKITGKTRHLAEQHAQQCAQIESRNSDKINRYKEQLEKWEADKADYLSKEADRRRKHIQKIEEENDATKREREAELDKWRQGDPSTILHFASLALKNADWPPPLKPKVESFYRASTKTILFDVILPRPDEMPTTKTVRYVSSTDEFKETSIPKAEARRIYEDMCYQVCLRTINDVLLSDLHKNIDYVAFNGRVIGKSKATGRRSDSVILSLIASRDDFKSLNLRHVDAKECFKKLRGVSATNLTETVAIAPTLQFDQNDKRFIEPHNVKVSEDGSTNLAELDWNDFEHLIREVFESEFRLRGGEVKVTQSSADGGVDAVAFDPDPISGGKIVIQAKRYTRTVDVSAVRDLYGTTQSEGAIKGILVTTSDYGPDAYRFAQNKPISLLNGANLLHLLEKHGHKATIDIAEARKNLGLSPRKSPPKKNG